MSLPLSRTRPADDAPPAQVPRLVFFLQREQSKATRRGQRTRTRTRTRDARRYLVDLEGTSKEGEDADDGARGARMCLGNTTTIKSGNMGETTPQTGLLGKESSARRHGGHVTVTSLANGPALRAVGPAVLLKWASSMSGRRIERLAQLTDGTAMLRLIARVLPSAPPAHLLRRARPFAASSSDAAFNWRTITASCEGAGLPVGGPHRVSLSLVRRADPSHSLSLVACLYFMHGLAKGGDEFSASFDGFSLLDDVRDFCASQRCVDALCQGGAVRKRRERNEAAHEAAVMELVRDKFRACEMRYGIARGDGSDVDSVDASPSRSKSSSSGNKSRNTHAMQMNAARECSKPSVSPRRRDETSRVDMEDDDVNEPRSGSAIYRMERRAPPTSDVGVVSTARHPRLATVLDELREVKTQLGANAELMTALQQALETQLTLMRPLIQAHRESLRRT